MTKRWFAAAAAALALGGCVVVPYGGYEGYYSGAPYDSYGYGPYYYYYDNLIGPAVTLGYFRYERDGRHQWHEGPRPPGGQGERPQWSGRGDPPDRGDRQTRGDRRSGGSPWGGRSEAWGQGGRAPNPSAGP